MECFWYNYIIIHCFFVHNYYAQPIYYTDVSKWCESLTDWSIPLRRGGLLMCTAQRSACTGRSAGQIWHVDT